MPVRGDFGALTERARALEEVGKGAAVTAAVEAMRPVARRLADESFQNRESPNGQPWGMSATAKRLMRIGRLTSAAPRTLQQSGKLRSSIRTERRGNGFRVISRAQAANGAYYSGTQQYGRSIRYGGGGTRRIPISENNVIARWRTVVGRVRIPARSFLPKQGTLPPEWDHELKDAATIALEQAIARVVYI